MAKIEKKRRVEHKEYYTKQLAKLVMHKDKTLKKKDYNSEVYNYIFDRIMGCRPGGDEHLKLLVVENLLNNESKKYLDTIKCTENKINVLRIKLQEISNG